MNDYIIRFLQKLNQHNAALMSLDVVRGWAVVEDSEGRLSNFYFNEELNEWL